MTLSANHSDKSDNDMTTNGDITTPGGTANSSAPSENHLPLIIVIAGPTATGKSTIGEAIAKSYQVPFIEGDELHSKHNIEKMKTGHPLTDSDRWEWLKKVATTSLSQALPHHHTTLSNPDQSSKTNKQQEEKDITSTVHNTTQTSLPPPPLKPSIIITCSALKRTYRDYLRSLLSNAEPPQALLNFVFLTGSEQELVERTEKRKNHYMKSDMVRSQLKTCEVPSGDELVSSDESDGKTGGGGDCRVVCTDDVEPGVVMEMAKEEVREALMKEAKRGREI